MWDYWRHSYSNYYNCPLWWVIDVKVSHGCLCAPQLLHLNPSDWLSASSSCIHLQPERYLQHGLESQSSPVICVVGIPSHKIIMGHFHRVQPTYSLHLLIDTGLASAGVGGRLWYLSFAGILEPSAPLEGQHGPKEGNFHKWKIHRTWYSRDLVFNAVSILCSHIVMEGRIYAQSLT